MKFWGFFSCKLSNSPLQMDHGVCPFKFMMDATQLTLSWQLKCESNRPTKSNCNKNYWHFSSARVENILTQQLIFFFKLHLTYKFVFTI